jgi:hypothetical protein
MVASTHLEVCTIYVYTTFVRNITFSADETAIERAREVARREHKTLNDAFREWLVQYGSRSVSAEEIKELYRSFRHVRAGRKFTRDEMNERR